MTHQISIAEANDLIGRFLANRTAILNGSFSELNPFTNSQTFQASSVLDVLGQKGTIGLRAYFGMYGGDDSVQVSKRNKIVLVLCSSDEVGNDLGLGQDQDGGDILIINDAHMCPPSCPEPSQINNLQTE